MPSEIEEIIQFEKAKLASEIEDEMTREIESWNARWRKEALEFYLPMGWSFLIRDTSKKSEYSDEGLLLGYFIGQPLLFFDNQTQTLWIEHMCFQSKDIQDQLCDLAYRLAREKHLQKVLFSSSAQVEKSGLIIPQTKWSPDVIQVKTTKASV